MIKVGITGGIGSGKSVVSELLKLNDIPVYISDDRAKAIVSHHPKVQSKLKKLVGDDLYAPDGTLDKPKLAAFLFKNSENTSLINAIVHPEVRRDFEQWVEEHSQHQIVAMEAAILFEANFQDEVDVVVTVYAPVDVRIDRAMKRDNTTRELVKQRINAQMSDEEKCKRSHFVIKNDGCAPILPQVLNLISFLSQKYN